MQASKYMVLKVDCKWSQKVFFKNKVLERLRTRETFKRSQTASAVPQFNYVIKVQGLKGVKLIGDNLSSVVRKTISYRLLISYLGTRFFYYTCAHFTLFLFGRAYRRAKALEACWQREYLYTHE